MDPVVRFLSLMPGSALRSNAPPHLSVKKFLTNKLLKMFQQQLFFCFFFLSVEQVCGDYFAVCFCTAHFTTTKEPMLIGMSHL